MRRGWLAHLLWPSACVFGALLALRRALYRTGVFKVWRVPVPVIVVGNVVVGGAGKTPVVIALVRHLQSSGRQVGVISRGYGRQSTDCRQVQPDNLARDVGDEPLLIQHRTAAPVFVAARRFEAARALLAAYPATELIVCDDGLQHLSLYRDLEICVFDERGIGNGWLLPAGPLREPWPRAVDLVLHSGTQAAFAGFGVQRTLSPNAVRADGSQIPLAQLADPNRANAKPLLALAAIAKPENFFALLRAQGLRLARTMALPDHYTFDSWSRNEYGDYTLICTEKDAVKLWPQQVDALAVPLLLSLPAACLARFDALIKKLAEDHANLPSIRSKPFNSGDLDQT